MYFLFVACLCIIYALINPDLIVINKINFLPAMFMLAWTSYSFLSYNWSFVKQVSVVHSILILKKAMLFIIVSIFCRHQTVKKYAPWFWFSVILVYIVIAQYIRNREEFARKVIIVGYNEVSKRLVQQLEEDTLNTKIIGYCEDEQEVHELSTYPIVGNLQNIIEVSKQYQANEIFSTIAPDENDKIYELMQQADRACIRFKLVPNFDTFTRMPVHVDYFGSLPVLSLRKEPLDDIANRVRKRIYDFVISSLMIILVLSWMIPLIGLLIWLDSRGPIFFIQVRTGKDNQPFRCIKFRSMKVNKDSDMLQATKGDVRVTKFGKFLRKSSLDEFPQFLNVFTGSMSIVGPRPHMLKHTDDYSVVINKYMVRQFVKPGITGWAQINGFRGETRSVWEMERRVECDIWYLENWSLWLDTRIIFLTTYKLFVGDINAV